MLNDNYLPRTGLALRVPVLIHIITHFIHLPEILYAIFDVNKFQVEEYIVTPLNNDILFLVLFLSQILVAMGPV